MVIVTTVHLQVNIIATNIDTVNKDHRRAMVLAGSRDWCIQTVNNLGVENALWISQQAPAGVQVLPARQARTILGQELQTVVFDAYSGFDVDAFAAITGTINGGGLLLLLTPALDDWPQFSDPEYSRFNTTGRGHAHTKGHFLQRFVTLLRHSSTFTLIEQNQSQVTPQLNFSRPEQTLAITATARAEQQQAVTALAKVVTGHRRRPVVLTADRGRGKSAAFGIAAACLLRQGCQRILITAPRLTAVNTVFEHASRLLPEARATHTCLEFNQAWIRFIAPDELLLNRPDADLLLVDEAAALPTAMLEKLLRKYSRIAFATTVHGYEGSGRGFALRFNKILDQHTPGWKALHLHTPIRWAAQDPLEQFVFQALLLNASPAPDKSVQHINLQQCRLERLDPDQLVNNEALLRELFGLLILAHYRTRPFDLRYLLDAANITVYILRSAEYIVATALVVTEGPLDSTISQAVYEGRRRLRGHLIPQAIATIGLPQGAELRYARIMRIAVHPALQNRGFGTYLLGQVIQCCKQQAYDGIGASFGANAGILRFWQKAGFTPVRLGLSRETSSGEHSALLLRAFSSAAKSTLTDLQHQFFAQFIHLLSDALRELEPAVAIQLLQLSQITASALPSALPSALSKSDYRSITAFAYTKRPFEVCLPALYHLSCQSLFQPETLSLLNYKHQVALLAKVLQKRRWSQVATLLQVPGRAQVIDCLRQAAQRLL